jgi:hypothetical protein
MGIVMAKSKNYKGGQTIVVDKEGVKNFYANRVKEDIEWASLASEVTVTYTEPIGVKRPWAGRKKRKSTRALGTNPRAKGTNPRNKKGDTNGTIN